LIKKKQKIIAEKCILKRDKDVVKKEVVLALRTKKFTCYFNQKIEGEIK